MNETSGSEDSSSLKRKHQELGALGLANTKKNSQFLAMVAEANQKSESPPQRQRTEDNSESQ
jgi:hypothetical protein